MSRARKNSGTSVSLFPFLSILVCMIGCLTLIIVVLNLIAMNKGEGREPEEIERAREFVELKKENDEDEKKLEELKQLIENLLQMNQEDIEKREKLTQLKEMLENQEEIDVIREELIAQFNLLQQTNKKLTQDEIDLIAQIVLLKKEIEERKLPPEAASLQVRPSGSGANTEPYFVEIADKTVLIHHSLTEPPVEIPSASLNQSEEFVELLKTVSAKPYRTLIFLVRGSDSSVANLNSANSVVGAFNRNTGAQILAGRLPLPGDGKIDLTMFEQYLK